MGTSIPRRGRSRTSPRQAFFPPATYGGVGGRSSVSISRGIQQTVRDRGATVRWGEVQEHKLRPHQVSNPDETCVWPSSSA